MGELSIVPLLGIIFNGMALFGIKNENWIVLLKKKTYTAMHPNWSVETVAKCFKYGGLKSGMVWFHMDFKMDMLQIFYKLHVHLLITGMLLTFPCYLLSMADDLSKLLE